MINGIFWKIGKDLAKEIEDLSFNLKVAKMKYTAEEWMTYAAKMMFLNGIMAGVIFGWVIYLISNIPLLSIFVGIAIGSISMIITFLIFVWYPKSVISSRRRKIENALPFVTYYMATISSSGIPPYKIFEMISKFEEFGEISRECRDIVKSMEVFGYTFTEAIERAIELSPSPKWKELLASILSTVTTGGDLRKLLMERARKYTEDFRRSLQSFSQTISLLLEVYITLVLVGTIMTTVIVLIIGLMGGLSKVLIFLQYLMGIVILPSVSIIFIFMVKATSPVEL